jgi:transcriptional regulator with XRE-family HTH domain
MEVREAKDIPPTRLDMLAGVSRGMTTRIENCDRPELSVSVLARIASHLNVSLDYLVFGDDEDEEANDDFAPEGLEMPSVSFLNKVHRLHGLVSFLESPDGLTVPIGVTVAAIKRFEEGPPQLDDTGAPKVGWKDYLSRIAQRSEMKRGA